MGNTIGIMFGFLGGTIFASEGGYKVLQHPNPNREYQRLSEAKWFLALRWCEQFATPAGILNYQGQLSFYNQAALRVGEHNFLPLDHRQEIFNKCLSLPAGTTANYSIFTADGRSFRNLEVIGMDIDPRYGRVAIVRSL
ncbi:hypothetical protein [Okeania sp. KiyG1]|uniref:hypothetical protein n=1 Tax=Okeania sp. KiyG1 TaxID=2720165 RepID=UPI001923F7D3|nr:hypothetical protein [Okeania sp. KiyG1]GGA29732.1 hypothetical protein CYANOKiyG1_46160 [Okeania sp. KiyG1]